MSDWQPIETAPKDGTRVDLWAKQWRASDDVFIYHRFADCWWTAGNPNRTAGWVNINAAWCATHWMPLPSPPEDHA